MGFPMGPGKTTYVFSVTFCLACYQQAGRVWSGGKGTENTLALAENVYVVLPTPGGNQPIIHPATSVLTSVLTSGKAISIVPSGGETDVRRANTDVRWVGFHPLLTKLECLSLPSFFQANLMALRHSA
jgi:hypothetical protein